MRQPVSPKRSTRVTEARGEGRATAAAPTPSTSPCAPGGTVASQTRRLNTDDLESGCPPERAGDTAGSARVVNTRRSRPAPPGIFQESSGQVPLGVSARADQPPWSSACTQARYTVGVAPGCPPAARGGGAELLPSCGWAHALSSTAEAITSQAEARPTNGAQAALPLQGPAVIRIPPWLRLGSCVGLGRCIGRQPRCCPAIPRLHFARSAR